MYKKGELVVYGNNGVCVVEDITTVENLLSGSEGALYYVLRSKISNGSVSYVPVDSNVFLRPVMTKAQAEAIIEKIPDIDTKCFQNITPRDAMRVYRDAINTHNTETLISLIKHIMETEEKKRSQNKKLSSTEERYLSISKKILESELTEALSMTEEELKNYILKRIK